MRNAFLTLNSKTMAFGREDMTSEILEDNDDLLHQLSAELGLPSFLDLPVHQENPLCEMDLSELQSNLLEDEIMQDLNSFQDNQCFPDSAASIFPELSGSESGYGESVKSEPNSPFSDPFSPSATDSDHSDGSRRGSPPLSPQQSICLPLSPLSPAPLGSTQSTIFMQSINPGAQVQDFVIPLSKLGKVPIPKIKKPSPPAPIVLQLGSDGLYYASQGPVIVKSETSTPLSPPGLMASQGYCSPFISASTTINTTRNAEELRNLKRQQRMIKNRESACISRKKKKEYLTTLEAQINCLSEENTKLRTENEQLRSKVKELEAEKKLWTTSLINSATSRKATAVFALIFMVTLNFNSLSGIYNTELNLMKTDPILEPHNGGRSLLWTQTDYEDPSEDVEVSNNSTNSNKPPPMCPIFFNHTESIRLESELRGWFNVDPAKSVKKKAESKPKPVVENKKAKSIGHVTRTPLQSLTGSLYHMLIQDPVEGQESRSISIYDSSPPLHTFASFFEAIDRRDDTFYVVSFSGDHLLVPATNHSQANRPRMSLLLPAISLSLNESHVIPGSIAMMKIDCEVTNTQLIQVKQDSIPAHLAANLRTGNISGEGFKFRSNQEKASTEGYGKNYRNSARYANDIEDPDNRTLDSDVPSFKSFTGADTPSSAKFKSVRRKKKQFGGK